MKEYLISITTLSDTMLGSGESVPGTIDSDVRYDSYGLPYMNAKTLKGHIREQMEMITEYAEEFHGYDLSELLGSEDKEADKKQGRLKFTKTELGEGISSAIRHAIDTNDPEVVSPADILNALCVIYSSTSIDPVTGAAKDHSLRRERMLRKGLKFYSKVYFDTDGMKEEDVQRAEKLLEMTIQAVQHIGTHKSKGKGHVRCRIEKEAMI